MANATFTSTIQTTVSIEDGATFVESMQPDAPIDCTISFKADLNAIFASVQMPDARTNPAASPEQIYYDFPSDAGSTLRGLLEAHIDSNWHQKPFGAAATYSSVYLEQVKTQLRKLFDNMSITDPANPSGVLPIGGGVVQLKNQACIDFLIDKTQDQNLATKTFIGTQLVELCEASARDAMRYRVDDIDPTKHRLDLRPGDSWTVRVLVQAKGAASSEYTNSQLWAVNIEQVERP